MNRAKEAVKKAYYDTQAKYGPIWETIDKRSDYQPHWPENTTGYIFHFLKSSS